jgi:hypothetical protein
MENISMLATQWHQEFAKAKALLEESKKTVNHEILAKHKVQGGLIKFDVPEDFIAALESYQQDFPRLAQMQKDWESNRTKKISVEHSGKQLTEIPLEKLVPKELVEMTMKMAQHICGLADAVLQFKQNK